MWDTSTRLLQLLALLQRPRCRTSDELAHELGVTTRTVRRDVARLRTLGYPVRSAGGHGGGYELEAGAALPPLTLDAPEAVAAALALQGLADGTAVRPVETSNALDKIRRILPDHVAPAVDAVINHAGLVDLGQPVGPHGPSSATETVTLLLRACRLRRRVICRYEKHTGEQSDQLIEPRHLVHTLGRWYLFAYSLKSNAWRTFRVDRIADASITASAARPRADPADDLDEYVAVGLRTSMQRVRGVVRVMAPIEDVARWVSPAWGTVSAESDGTAVVAAGADSYVAMAKWLLLLDAPLVVVDPPELLVAFGEVAAEASRVR
ncbi:YafY family protein [Frigoribacterium sp. RIT-PI-h]|uniref:helix-turn-helix transcriptional regulator n=1 Tax=Frigoribacterium sp. RIT-PI-h TaxID=1690245 RepID=UPI0006CDD51A|nr:WYL domain-containing protein [Frigoribacterium sp. RIT-PI-h]KPG80224.1 hypothetical protein AEQ27_12645 [Frigoribacterium sp. RIT-PI-h]